jgi:hypothetical protein
MEEKRMKGKGVKKERMEGKDERRMTKEGRMIAEGRKREG